MLKKSDSVEEINIVNELIESDTMLRIQHEVFLEEMKFKQMLIDARKTKEMTQKEVSLRSGLSQQAVSRLEKGHGGTIDTVIKYLYSIGFSLSIERH